MKILKVKQKSVIFDANGTKCLRYVIGNRFLKNDYTHVQIDGKIYPTNVTIGVFSPIVWIN